MRARLSIRDAARPRERSLYQIFPRHTHFTRPLSRTTYTEPRRCRHRCINHLRRLSFFARRLHSSSIIACSPPGFPALYLHGSTDRHSWQASVATCITVALALLRLPPSFFVHGPVALQISGTPSAFAHLLVFSAVYITVGVLTRSSLLLRMSP
jgi:hypothetical protein